MANDVLEKVEKRLAKGRLGGGQDKIDRQHAQGKLSARERIEQFLDEGSFEETDGLVEHNCSDFGMGEKKIAGDGVVTGWEGSWVRYLCVIYIEYINGFPVIQKFKMKQNTLLSRFSPYLLAILIGVPITVMSTFLLVSGFRYMFFGIIGFISLVFVLRYPEIPMVVLFPLIWPFWSYYSPILGGRLERLIGLIAIFGVLVVLLNDRNRLVHLPPKIFAGLILLFGACLLSSLLNSIPNPVENLVSLGTRIIFLYLVYFLLRKPQHLRLAGILLVISGIISAIIILYWNLLFGLGFIRTYQENLLAMSKLGTFWYSLILGGNSLTFPAVLLLGLIPALDRRYQRFLALLVVVFLFAMAFIAQFRREILVTISGQFFYILS